MNDKKIIEIRFNGALYLARDARYSNHYLGSGKTYQEAISEMEKTIKVYNLKPREKTYF